MNFLAKVIDQPLQNATHCAVVFCANKKLQHSAKEFDQALGSVLSKTIELGDLKDKIGEYHWVTCSEDVSAKRILLVNIGKMEKALSGEDLRSLVKSIASALIGSNAKDATLFIDQLFTAESGGLDNFCQELAQQVQQSRYRYTETKSQSDDKVTLSKVTLALGEKSEAKTAKAALIKGEGIGQGINLARELGNLPPNICTPSYLQALASEMAETSAALTTKTLSEKQLGKLGMGSFLSVAKGSDESGKLIIMEYRGAEGELEDPKNMENVSVLVGKGITFDSGGISLKPGLQMDEMKFDMCGAASVFGVIKALIETKAEINVVGLVAAAENMPSGKASKPGDVVTSMSGKTIEILNTDAEGRLVLCDTLTYAERYKPRAVIDIATLTGACVIALGSHATGLYANDQQLADHLVSAGESTLDKAWQMPLWKEYVKQLDSNFADMANIGGREAGSVTAACFLSKFTEAYPWAHLDIAGTAWHSGAKKGATGRPVALLTDYLLNHANTTYQGNDDTH